MIKTLKASLAAMEFAYLYWHGQGEKFSQPILDMRSLIAELEFTQPKAEPAPSSPEEPDYDYRYDINN